jgi:FKBP-type peptidyl-prolyl cis-trans isomerase SlyD
VNITKDTVVTLTYIVKDLEGQLLEESQEPVSYLHGGYDNIFPMVEAALEGKAVGEKVDLKLQPADAFGEYEESLVRLEPREAFPPDIEIGMQFVGSPADGHGEEVLYSVTDIAEDKVVVDGNHPYAGQAVHFQCVVSDVRAATADEVAHRHAHGAHGHHHH